MPDYTTKDWFGDGYTTRHEDGSTSYTTKDWFGDGYTTTHSDGSHSYSTKDWYGDGVTNTHSDGSRSYTTKDWYGDGYTTRHADGSTSYTTKDWYGDGYTTTTYGGTSSYGGYGTYSAGSTSSYPVTPSGGYYGGGYYGGSLWTPGRLGVLGIVLTCIGVGGAFFLTNMVMGAFPWITAAFLAVVIILAIVQRNRHIDAKRQDVWYGWAWILTTLFCFYTMLYSPALVGSIEFLGTMTAFPTVFLLVMGYILIASIQPSDESCGLEVTMCVTAAVFGILRFYDFEWLYFLVMDIMFVAIGIKIIVLLVRSVKDCKLAIAAAPLCLCALFMTWSMLTDFSGLRMIPEFLKLLF